MALRKMVAHGLPIEYERGREILLGLNEKARHSKDVLEEFVLKMGGTIKHREIGLNVLEESLCGIEIEEEFWVNDFLRGLPYRKAIVTAGNSKVQEEKIDRFGIDRTLFEEIIVEEKGKKERSYSRLQEKFGKFLVVGDRILDDLSGAKKIGGITIHIRQGRGKIEPKGHPDVDYEITTINELKGILERL